MNVIISSNGSGCLYAASAEVPDRPDLAPVKSRGSQMTGSLCLQADSGFLYTSFSIRRHAPSALNPS